MPFQSALTSDQLETLRGTTDFASHYEGAVYVSACPNEVIYSARVNQASFTSSFAQVTYDGGAGTLADVRPGHTVILSHINDVSKGYFVGRIRKTPTGTIFYINETSAPVADNDYIFIIDDFKIWDKLGRQVSGVQYHDYDITFRQLLPLIYNLRSGYADWVDPDIGVLSLDLTALTLAATSGASIMAVEWDVADGTITAGDTDEISITVEFEPGFRWIHFTATDTGSRSITRHIPIWAHHPDTYPPQLLDAGSPQTSGDVASGFDASLAAYSGLDDLLDNTLIVAWAGDERYQDGTASLTGDNITFVGRIRKRDSTSRADETASIDGDVQLTLESPLTQLVRIEQLPYEMLNKTSTPTAFGQIRDMTLWRGIVYLLSECSTFLELHSLRFDDTSNKFLAPTRNPVGNILNAINDLAGSYNAALQMNAAGEAEIVRDARMLSYDKDGPDERDNLPTIANWTSSDILDIALHHSDARTVGRLKANGGSFNSVNNRYNTFDSIAPGVAQEYAEGSTTLERQVLTANVNAATSKAELNQRAGDHLERVQEVDTLDVTFPDGYFGVLIPALDQWHTFTVDDDDRNIHLDSSIRWLLLHVEIAHNSAEGTKEVKANFTRETHGAPGQYVKYPDPTDVPNDVPQLPPSEPYPAYPIDMGDVIGDVPPVNTDNPDTVPTNGNAVITGTSSLFLVVVNPTLTPTPGTRDVTPPDLLGEIRHGKLGAGKDCYCLSSDGENSRLHYTEDVFAGDVVWTHGDDVEGDFSVIRVGSTQGEVYIEGIIEGEGGDYTTVDTFTVDGDNASYTAGTYNTIVGRDYKVIVSGLIQFGSGGDKADAQYYSLDGTFGSPVRQNWVQFSDSTAPDADDDTFNPTHEYTFSRIGDGSPISLRFFDSEYSDNSLSWDIEVQEAPSSNGLVTAYSPDFGQTFDDPKTVSFAGTEVGGIDTAKIASNVVLVGAPLQVMSAESGGDYEAYGTTLPDDAFVRALFIPRYQLTSTSVGNDPDTPEFVVALAGADVDDETMYRVTAGGNTFFGITPTSGGNPGTAVSPSCLVMPWRSGAIILAVLDFDGTRKLAVSVNTGSSWTFSSALEEGAVAVSVRKSDLNNKQAFIANGSFLGYCSNYRANPPVIKNRNIGVSEDLLFVEIYG